MLDSQQESTDELDNTFSIFTPPPNVSATEWADKYFYLSQESSAEPGKFNSGRTPFVRGILDEFTNPDTEYITVRAPRQIIKTTFILIGLGYTIHLDPCPMLVLEPTLDLGQRVSKRRVSPMFRDTPVLAEIIGPDRSRVSDNTIMNKSFPGGALTIAGANSTAGLISEPRKKLFFDEIDYYPPSIKNEGNPIATAEAGSITFWDRKIVKVSRPSVKDISPIDKCFEQSDQRYYHVPCHACGKKQKLEWEQVKWTDNDPKTAVYVCKFCGAAWDDGQRVNAMMQGQWIGEKPFEGHAGFTLNGIYHIWRPLPILVKNFLYANEQKRMGNLQPLHDWLNDEFGESWAIEAEKIEAQPLMERRENYGPGSVPWRVLYLTAAVDDQDDRVEVEVFGWRATKRQEPEERWSVEKVRFFRNKTAAGESRRSNQEVWNELDEYLKREFQTEDGRPLRISATCIDSGGHHTDEVYRFCNPRASRHIYAVKGMDGPRPIWPPRASKSKKHKGSLVRIVGVDTAKDAIYGSLKVVGEGPGRGHYPNSYTIEDFQEVTAERVTLKYRRGRQYRVWECPHGVPNHGLDLHVYALAALRARSVPWEILLRSAPIEPPAPKKPPEPGGETAPSENAPAAAAPKTSGRKIRFRFGKS
jgi:phage terminase large subunit GpA-like protein